MKIALAFFGLPRNSAIAFPSIERHLMAPLAAQGELQVFHHLYRQRWVHNARSGEDQAQREENYAPFAAFRGTIEARPARELPLLQRLKSYGDAWQDGFRSLTNLVLQLQSLLAVTQLVAGAEPDLVVFARRDLLYHDPLPAAEIQRALASHDHVALPCWESWGGFNDRFALAGARAWRAYGGRLLLADHYCETTRQAMHAETFLRYALRFAGVGVRTIPLRASRVRVHGGVEAEDFEGLRTPLASGQETGPPGR